MLPIPPPELLSDASLFLDFDGTLVDIAERPDLVRVDAQLRALLAALGERLDGRVAMISGRSVDDLHLRLGDDSIIVAGSHGCEFAWPDGRREAPLEPDHLVEMVASAMLFAGDHPGVLIERKPFGVAIHYRQSPQFEEASVVFARTLLEFGGYTLQPGRMVIELKPENANKGSALRRLMRAAPMTGGTPLFIGDDRTDEAGFIAARDLGGAGVLVGPMRQTEANFGLPDVASVRNWLAAVAEARA